MRVVILAGGRGSRLGGELPKPMIEIGGIPVLSHIMGIYRKYGHNEFVVATGYRGDVIREYYKNDSNVTCLNTGLDSGTGERVRECAEHLGRGEFLLTYGDGVSDVNIDMLIKAHHKKITLTTVTAVHPPARFGQLVLRGDKVSEFNEKAHNQHEWVNGGFFVTLPSAIRNIAGDSWEFDVLPVLAEDGYLTAYRHEGFWQCMDTQRDVDYLNQLWKDGAPWK